jgi:hypothetical protein
MTEPPLSDICLTVSEDGFNPILQACALYFVVRFITFSSISRFYIVTLDLPSHFSLVLYL